MTVRQQLEAWGVDVERLLNADMDLDQFERLPGRDPQVQAWCDGIEMEIHVHFPDEPPLREVMIAATMERCGCTRTEAETITDRVADRVGAVAGPLPLVAVPCEPTNKMLREGDRALDAWTDDALAEMVDGMEMAGRVWKAMTSAAPSA